jgi:WD40 repeat protein
VIDFFISYAREDGEFARALVERLTDQNWDVWIDEKDIPPSVPWMTEIQHAIDESMVVIAIDSPDWQTSAACHIELDLAEQRRVPIVRVTPDAARLDELVREIVKMFLALPPSRKTVLQTVAAASIWEAAGRRRSLLVRGAPLRVMRRTLAVTPGDFSEPARAFVRASRQASVRRWMLGLVVGVIAPLLGLAILVSLQVAAKVDERVAKRVADATAFAERSTYADWNIYSGLERSPSSITDSYTEYYQLFSFLAERTPSAWDPVPVTDGGVRTAVSPDGGAFASIDGAAIVVTRADGAIVRLLATAPASSLAWSPDSRWIAVTTEVGADVISVENAQVIPLRGGGGTSATVRWESQSDVVVGGTSGSGTWRVFDGQAVARVEGVRYATIVAGSLYSVSITGIVSKTDLGTGVTRALDADLPAGAVPSAIDSIGSTVVVAFDAPVPFLRVIETNDESFRDLEMPACSPLALSLAPDAAGAYLACSGTAANETRVDLATGSVVSQPMQHQVAYGVRALDDRVIWGGRSGRLSASDLDLTPRGVVSITAGCGAPIRKLVGDSDGSALFQIGDATGSFSCASRVELTPDVSGEADVHRLILPPSDGHAAPDAAVSPDGSLVAYGLSDGRVRVFTTSQFYPVYFAQVLPDQVRAVSFSDDGSKVIVAGLGGEIVTLPLPTTPAEDGGNELTSDALTRLQNAVDWGIYESTMDPDE